MNTPLHIVNLQRASAEAWKQYEQAIDDPTVERDMLNEMGKAAEILSAIFRHEYNDPMNWVEAVEVPTVIMTQSVEL